MCRLFFTFHVWIKHFICTTSFIPECTHRWFVSCYNKHESLHNWTEILPFLSFSLSVVLADRGWTTRVSSSLHGALLHHALLPKASVGRFSHLYLLRQLPLQTWLRRVTHGCLKNASIFVLCCVQATAVSVLIYFSVEWELKLKCGCNFICFLQF